MIEFDDSRLDVADVEFEKRLDNWRRTVLYLGHGTGTACPSWAAMYIKTRDALDATARPASMRNLISVQELDGWVIEAAWSALTNEDDKTVLKLWYVRRATPETIRCSMRLRRVPVNKVLERAKNNLQKELAKLK